MFSSVVGTQRGMEMVWPLMDVVANIDLWALSPWITGQVIVVDGSFNCKLLLIDPDMPLFTSELLFFKGEIYI